MRIVISANTAWNLYNFRAGLIRSLLDCGIEVVAVAPPDDEYAGRLAELGCRFEAIPMDSMGTSPLSDTLLALRFIRLFRRLKPDRFLGFTVKPNIYGSIAARLCGIPVINNISGLGTAFLGSLWLNWVVRILYRLALRDARHVFFQNPDDRRLFLDGRLAHADRSSVLPGSGVDLDWFCLSTGEPPRRAGMHFLLIARLLRDKGIVEFVEAARLVKAARGEARFTLLGFLGVENRSAIDAATLSAWVEEGVVDYAGSAEDVRPFIADADCVVLPSYREGTPRTLLEAAAMAKPLIASDVPGCREVVDDGVNGYLCRARDGADLARQCERFLDLSYDDRLRMGKASRSKAERQFDEKFVVRRYIEVIDGRVDKSGTS
jgi:glycosyltransferase involved in cell wall biosynthesis